MQRLKQYERYLEIEFDAKNGKTIEEKTEALRNVYRKIKTRLEKQKATLRAAGKAQISRDCRFAILTVLIVSRNSVKESTQKRSAAGG